MTFIYILRNSLTFLQTNYDACKIIYITNKLIIITMNNINKIDIISTIAELNQYLLGNVTDFGLSESLKYLINKLNK